MAHKESYKTFERGTAAGNKLYNLYHKKPMDSTLDRDLLERLQKMRKEKDDAARLAVTPAVVPKSKAHVVVPKFGRPKRSSSMVMPRGGGKKSEDAIAQEKRVDVPPAAPAARRGITAKDKLKLQHIMEFGEALPEPGTVGLGGGGASPQRRLPPSERDTRVAHFTMLAQEVDERKQFLADMNGDGASAMECCKKPGDKRATELRIMNEIGDRVDEMKSVDDWLRNRPPSQ